MIITSEFSFSFKLCILLPESISQRKVHQRPATSHSMRKFILAIIYVYAISVISSITKRRLCLSYRMESTRGGYAIFHSTTADGEHWCMIKCIRDPHCWAFNFLYDGTCELLPTLDDCKEPRSHLNSTFVHLSTCEGKTPVDLSPRNWTENECLTWIPHNKDFPCPPGVLMSSSTDYCLSLAPWYGLYMPGWFESPGGFRLVTEDRQTLRCPDGYLLKTAVGCTTTWQDYIVGDPVPPNAVQVSVSRDGTPLYCVEYHPGIGTRGYYIGYYIQTIQKTYIMSGGVYSPTHVKMLVFNWSVCQLSCSWCGIYNDISGIVKVIYLLSRQLLPGDDIVCTLHTFMGRKAQRSNSNGLRSVYT